MPTNVIFPADASAVERTAVICHELAHMLLSHQPEACADRLSQMAALVAPSIDPAIARGFLVLNAVGVLSLVTVPYLCPGHSMWRWRQLKPLVRR